MKFENVFLKNPAPVGLNLTRDRGARGLAACLACWAEMAPWPDGLGRPHGRGGPSHRQDGWPAHAARALVRVTAHTAAWWRARRRSTGGREAARSAR
jgi:hypothetical protein